MTTRWARFVRGWIAASIAVFVALCSHVLSGGDPPDLPGILLCLAFAGMICIALSGRSLSTPRLAIAVGASQFLFHGFFAALGAAPMTGPAGLHSTGMQMTGMHMSTLPSGAVSTTHALPAAAADSGMAMPAWMWVGHAIAAVITVIVLRYAEGAFWRMIELARPLALAIIRMLSVVGRPVAVRPRPLRITVADVHLPPRLVVLSALRHRGPPSLAAF